MHNYIHRIDYLEFSREAHIPLRGSVVGTDHPGYAGLDVPPSTVCKLGNLESPDPERSLRPSLRARS